MVIEEDFYDVKGLPRPHAVDACQRDGLVDWTEFTGLSHAASLYLAGDFIYAWRLSAGYAGILDNF